MPPEKLKPVAVDLDRAPGMGVHQLRKIAFQLFLIQLIGTAIKVVAEATNRTGIGINCLLTFPLKLE